ncbi:response regulator transcription factor [Kiloniella laminariae]|uniref:Response regulator transcription factor n=1 Tax=Kiloniella laminariae TaxID=454162 RepID=A0ABT4LIG6_9PROT|nr:response regulator transcription factor [Kiloniella laminariae]MCZ4280889.1 response regulator transcription factor [Kiloniella laminariae]
MLANAVKEIASPRVILVDDDDLFRESLGLNLAEEGFDVVDFDNGSDVLSFLLNEPSLDPILLDWRMPGLDGLAVLRRLREARMDNPVIFLTMLSDEIYEEAALRWGAVDFIDKSRRLPIILQRLRLISEGTKGILSTHEDDSLPNSPSSAKVGGLEIREDIRRAYWKGEQLDLTLTEFAIVCFLAGNEGNDISYRQIYDLVHGKDFVAGYGSDGYKANVRSFIKRIRKKFRELDDSFEQIENYPGFGYRWRPAGATGTPE